MTLKSEIVVVSGLPRSGTSLMVQMLDQGGLSVLTDQQRTADVDNPRGYYEFELVKRMKSDTSWLPEARGKVVKVVSALLYDLPVGEQYRIVFMQRDLDEVIASQEKMLERRGRPIPPREKVKAAFELHLERLFEWLGRQPHMPLLTVSYNDLMSDARRQSQRVCEFLDGAFDGALDADHMLAAIDPALYRNRAAAHNSASS